MINEDSKDLIEISEVTSFSENVFEVLKELLKQLTTAHLSFSESDFKAIISSKNSTLIVAKDHSLNGKIVGTLTYITFRIPTGFCFRIEDVVVDQSARGKGVGKRLMIYAIERAKEMGAEKIDLTSSAERVAANKLYMSLGFKSKETNVYRLG
jgi:ribosomal protein S18 acetylase RimI-like enzyme